MEGPKTLLDANKPTTPNIIGRELAEHYRPRIKSQKTSRSVVEVEPAAFRAAATNNDKG